jgi:hypothetical protein
MHFKAARPPSRLGPDGRRTLSPALDAALVVLGLLTAIYLAWPIWRAVLPLAIDPNETWNAYHADDVLAGRNLYPDPAGLVINNYPPLSFYLISAISRFTFDPFYVGRMLSLVAILATAGAIFSIVRRLGGSRMAALLGALWFCATLARFFDRYAGMNDPNLVALMLMTWALAWLLRRRAAGQSPEPAILLMVFAGFYKHNLFAIPITAICWLTLSDVRAAARAAVVGGAAAVAGLALCGMVFGDVFFESLLTAREFSLETAILGLGRLQWIAPALVVFGIWAWHQREGEAVRFSALFVAIAFVFQFLQKLGAGVDDNAQFELVVATAIGLGLAFESIVAIPAARRFGQERSRLAVVLVLILRLLFSLRMEPYLLVVSPEFRAELRQRSSLVASETARIAAISGPVMCMVPSVCRWAGQPFLLDVFYVQQRIAAGRISWDEAQRRLRALGLRTEPVDPLATLDLQ